jgi:putative peptidoglycan lipid II flippase
MTRAAASVAAATLLSRLLGYARDAMIAWYFGAGFQSDAFLAAFRIPNIFRRLVGEGALSSAFVPVFTEALWKGGHAEARAVGASAARFLALALVAISAAGILLAPGLVRLITPGFSAAKLDLTITLTRLMFPYLVAVGMMSLAMGILNACGSFAAPALAPAVFNLAMIGSLLALAPLIQRPTVGLAVGVLIGGGLQLLLQLPALVHHRLNFWRRARFYHPALKRAGRLMLPAVLGGAAFQINILVGTLLASWLAEGSVSYLYYADRLVEFPLGVLSVAGATAVLPSMSREAAAGDYEALRRTFENAFRMVSFVALPAMGGLIVLGDPIVRLLFVRGEFGSEAARLTYQALLYYAVGLWAFSAARIVVAAFYALQDGRTPVRMAMASILANMLLGAALMQPLAHCGLALATSLAAFLNTGLLLLALRKRLQRIDWRAIALSVLRALFGALVMAAAVAAARTAFSNGVPLTAAGHALRLGALIAIGILVYGAMSLALRSPELWGLMRLISRSLRQR